MFAREARWASRRFSRSKQWVVFQSASDWPNERLRCENLRALDISRGTARQFWSCSNILQKIARVPILYRCEKVGKRIIHELGHSWLLYFWRVLLEHAKVVRKTHSLSHYHLPWRTTSFDVSCWICLSNTRIKSVISTPERNKEILTASRGQLR